MAGSQRIVAVDLGSSCLKLAEFQVDGSHNMTLLNYGMKDLGVDPSKDQDLFPFHMEAVTSTMGGVGIGASQGYCSLSGQFVFTKFVKLPPVQEDQVDQMIGFEAQQNVPFPIDEVVWDYQLLGQAGSMDLEAIIVAIKKDLVEQAASVMGVAKLPLKMMDVAPLALINAYRYNYPDVSDPTLLVDIGAKSTNLIFVEPDKVFCRVIPIGGHMISQNIANEFQEPFVASELLKKGKGFVGLGGAYADPDDAAAARISKIARGVFSRLHAEVSRSVSFYKNQQKGNAPRQILLAGGTSALAYSDLFFKEKFNMPVDYFNPLRNVGIGSGVDRARLANDAAVLGVAVGLGLRALKDTPVEVNLEPASSVAAREKAGKMPYLIAALFVWIGMFALISGANYIQSMSLAKDRQEMERVLNNKSRLSRAINKANTAVVEYNTKLGSALKFQEQRDLWPDLVTILSKAAASREGVWLSKVVLLGEGGGHVENAPTPKAASGRRASNRRNQPKVTAPKPNLAPLAHSLQVEGWYEAATRDNLMNAFLSRLEDSGLFETVEVKEHVGVKPGDEQVAVYFKLNAVFKEDSRPDLNP